jgi:hypothetical protein
MSEKNDIFFTTENGDRKREKLNSVSSVLISPFFTSSPGASRVLGQIWSKFPQSRPKTRLGVPNPRP